MLFADELAALAVDPPHRVDHLVVGTLELALDRGIKPALGPAPVDDLLRKFLARTRERVDLVIAAVGGVHLAIDELECGFLGLLSRWLVDVKDTFRTRFERKYS